MAHYRIRYVEPWIEKILKMSPLVGVLGHRQVGKTSLVERISASYFTLDKKDHLEFATNRPEEFVAFVTNKKHPVVIDECQYAPPLFSALKEHVRLDKRPGQFILTGSVRFSSRAAIKESLTGRIINIEVPPLGVAEILEEKEPQFLKIIFEKGINAVFKNQKTFLNGSEIGEFAKSFEKYPTLGGLPGVCFIRDAKLRQTKFDAQLETILDRDLRLITETTLPFHTLRRILEELAMKVGEPLNIAELQRRTRVSVNTLKKLLYAFEAMFLLSTIPNHDRAAQPILFFCDSGEAEHLGQLSEEQTFTQNVFSQLRAQLTSLWNTQLPSFHLTHFRTRGGTFIPLVIHIGKISYGFLPKTSAQSMSSVLAQAESFLSHTDADGVVVLNPQSNGIEKLAGKVLSIQPAHLLL